MQSHRPVRLPSTRFSGLTARDIRSAIARYRAGATHPFGDSTRYDLIFDGERYPPKAIFGLAAERVVSRPLTPYDFAGGLGSICFRTLAKLGFSVVPKTVIEDLPEETLPAVDENLPPVGAGQPEDDCPLSPPTKPGAPRVGGRRISRRAKKLGDRAEECVFKHLELAQAEGRITGLRWLAREGLTPGWDIQYEELPSRTLRRVEVKGAIADKIGAFDLTAKELAAALEHGTGFGLALVTNSAASQPTIYYLWDVARWFSESRLVREPLVWGVRMGPGTP